MSKTTLPSWLQPAPKNVGSPSAGRLKADQWRTFATVHLVITLVRLWSHLPDKKVHLDNFLALVTAVRWATMRSTSADHIRIVREKLVEYLSTMVILFPFDNVRTNQHMALHVAECLSMFGPVHGWWTFPFERYNGVIVRTNTNSRSGMPILIFALVCALIFIAGDMELTFLMSFCRGANLKAFWAVSGLAETVRDIKNLASKYFSSSSDFYGTLFSDISAFEASADRSEQINTSEKNWTVLPDATYQSLGERVNIESQGMDYRTHRARQLGGNESLLSPEAHHFQSVKVGGATLTTADHSESNSMVMFRASPLQSTQSAGQILSIFAHTRGGPDGSTITENFVCLKPFKKLSNQDSRHDPYLHYPLLDVRLYYNVFDPPVVAKVSDVVSHVATCPFTDMGRDYRIVLSLDRVRRPPIIDVTKLM